MKKASTSICSDRHMRAFGIRRHGTLFVILSACAYGICPLLAVKIYSYGCSAAMLIFLRSLLPFPILLAISRKKGGGVTSLWPSCREDGLLLAATGLLGSVVTPILLLTSYQYVSAGIATTLHFSYPAFVYILSLLSGKGHFQVRKILCYLACSAGIAMLNGANSGNLRGNFLALASGGTYALYIDLLNRCTEKSYSPTWLSTIFCMIGIPLCGTYCVLTGGFTTEIPPAMWGYAFLYVLLATVVGAMLFQFGVSYVGGEKAAIFSCVEPITSIVLGCVVSQQVLKSQEIVAIGLIIAAITISMVSKSNLEDDNI